MALMPVADALKTVLAGVSTLGPEQVGIRFSLGRTLAHHLSAAVTHPPFNASAMDGYAVRAADCSEIGARLKLSGESAAGWPFGGSLRPGEAIRIFTGACVPDGADAVVIQEDTTSDGVSVTVNAVATAGDNIRERGKDFHEGDVVLKRGQRLNPRDILMAAASGHAMAALTRRPIVAILATGDELVEPSDRPAAGQIIASNAYGIAALVEAAGGVPKMLGIAMDTAHDLAIKFADGQNADILVTIGGASVGDHDLVRPTLEASGAVLHFFKIAMRPGKPTFFGTRKALRGTQRIVGLPGNPLSAMISARLFLVPLISAMLGRPAAPRTIVAELSVDVPANGIREHYMRAQIDIDTIPPRVAPLANQDSSYVTMLTAANALLVLPANSPALPAGTRVTVMPLDF